MSLRVRWEVVVRRSEIQVTRLRAESPPFGVAVENQGETVAVLMAPVGVERPLHCLVLCQVLRRPRARDAGGRAST